MAEVGTKGAWRRLFEKPDLWKFEAPTIEGVNFPSLGITEAWNDPDAGLLHVQTSAAYSNLKGMGTTFSITNLPDPDTAEISCDGQLFHNWHKTSEHSIKVDTDINPHNFRITTGYHRENIPAPRSSPSEQGKFSPKIVASPEMVSWMPSSGRARTQFFSCCSAINSRC